jgi:hypothetical protein
VDEAGLPHDPRPDPEALGRVLLAEAARKFRAGEFRASAETTLEAGEQAKLAGRPDLLAAAALTSVGVPDPATAPTVERLSRDALSVVDPGDLGLQARLHAQLVVALHHRGRLDEAAIEVGRATALRRSAG